MGIKKSTGGKFHISANGRVQKRRADEEGEEGAQCGEGGPSLDVELFKGWGIQTAKMFLPICGC